MVLGFLRNADTHDVLQVKEAVDIPFALSLRPGSRHAPVRQAHGRLRQAQGERSQACALDEHTNSTTVRAEPFDALRRALSKGSARTEKLYLYLCGERILLNALP
jgi:hypothetical protein